LPELKIWVKNIYKKYLAISRIIIKIISNIYVLKVVNPKNVHFCLAAAAVIRALPSKPLSHGTQLGTKSAVPPDRILIFNY